MCWLVHRTVQLLSVGRRLTVAEAFARIDAVDTNAVKSVARRFLEDKVRCAAILVLQCRGALTGAGWLGVSLLSCRTWLSLPSATSTRCQTTTGCADARLGCERSRACVFLVHSVASPCHVRMQSDAKVVKLSRMCGILFTRAVWPCHCTPSSIR